MCQPVSASSYQGYSANTVSIAQAYCGGKPCSTEVFFAAGYIVSQDFTFLKTLSLETTYRATTPVSSPQHCSTWPCAKPRQRLFRLFCKQAVQHYCPECASKLCTVPSHMPSYLFTRSCIIRTACSLQIPKVLAEFTRKDLPICTAATIAACSTMSIVRAR